jgi:hypothetical protein
MSEEFELLPFFIKPGYCARTSHAPTAESRSLATDLVQASDAYALAAFLAARTEAYAIINIGDHANPQRMMLPGVREISIDLCQIVDNCAPVFSNAIWIGTDLGSGQPIQVDAADIDQSVIVCANVIERLLDPSALLAFLSSVAGRAHATIITTPERDVVRGQRDNGPPADPSHVREWNTGEFEQLLDAWHLRSTFLGLTSESIHDPVKDTILAILDRCPVEAATAVPDDFRPLAIIATYNDQDIVPQIVTDLLDDGIDVHVLDNWSTDETFEQLSGLSTSRSGLTLERFPATGSTPYLEWRAILERKEEVAAQFSNRWVIHQDSDELRRSPWPEISLRAGLYIAERMGFNAIDFTVCNFRPIDDSFAAGMHPEAAFRFFEFGRHPAHLIQVKTWRQGEERVTLATTGGHQAEFSGRRIFPYKFLLKHYQLRSPAHARQKVFERRSRFSPQELAIGWHDHYNHLTIDDSFVWRSSELTEFDERAIRRKFLTELVAGIGIVR